MKKVWINMIYCSIMPEPESAPFFIFKIFSIQDSVFSSIPLFH